MFLCVSEIFLYNDHLKHECKLYGPSWIVSLILKTAL